MCYYFKSKYDNLELAQNEQAKILYEILQKERQKCLVDMCCPNEFRSSPPVMSRNEPMSDDSSDESDDETSSTSSDVEELGDLVIEKEDEVKHLSIQETPVEPQEEISFIVTKVEKVEEKSDDYGKMTMKQLKELLSNKGIKTKPNMRKEELIELINKKDLPVSGSPNFGSFSSENIEIEGMEEIST